MRTEEQKLKSASSNTARANAEQERKRDAAILSCMAQARNEDASRYAARCSMQAQVGQTNRQLMERRSEAARQERQRELEFERELSANHFDRRWGMSDR